MISHYFCLVLFMRRESLKLSSHSRGENYRSIEYKETGSTKAVLQASCNKIFIINS